MQELFTKHKVKPWVSLLVALGQLPLWMGFFFTLRAMSYLT